MKAPALSVAAPPVTSSAAMVPSHPAWPHPHSQQHPTHAAAPPPTNHYPYYCCAQPNTMPPQQLHPAAQPTPQPACAVAPSGTAASASAAACGLSQRAAASPPSRPPAHLCPDRVQSLRAAATDSLSVVTDSRVLDGLYAYALPGARRLHVDGRGLSAVQPNPSADRRVAPQSTVHDSSHHAASAKSGGVRG
jgi:hypothetical protein